MVSRISPRIAACVDALPLKPGLRVLEIGCGPGVAAREVSRRLEDGFVLAIDRSATAIEIEIEGSAPEIATGMLEFRHSSIEEFELAAGEAPFDIAFALRVGALDGRHPEAGRMALGRLRAVLKPNGRLFIDGGRDLKELQLCG